MLMQTRVLSPATQGMQVATHSFDVGFLSFVPSRHSESSAPVLQGSSRPLVPGCKPGHSADVHRSACSSGTRAGPSCQGRTIVRRERRGAELFRAAAFSSTAAAPSAGSASESAPANITSFPDRRGRDRAARLDLRGRHVEPRENRPVVMVKPMAVIHRPLTTFVAPCPEVPPNTCNQKEFSR